MFARARLALMLVTGLAAAGMAVAQTAPLQGLSLMAWMGGWQSLRAPAVAAPPATGIVEGDLEQAFHVAWQRQGDALRVKITKRADAWVGRLAVEFRYVPALSTLTYGYGDLPVPVPVAQAPQGQFLWSWEYGLPSWLRGESAQGATCAIFETSNSHGFFLNRLPDGTLLVHVNLDWPKVVGDSVEAAFRLAPDMTPAALQAERRHRLGLEGEPPLNQAKLKRLRAAGLVRVDRSGWGFATSDGKPVRFLGQNTPHLVTLTPVEQERLLTQSEAAGITVTRMLISDYGYRPLGQCNPEAYRRLLAAIERCASHGIRTVVCLEYSGCAMQYNLSVQRTPNWSDLYLLPEAMDWYRDTVARVVTPLRDNPAVLAYDVTNEPDMALAPATPTLTAAWGAWLTKKYGTLEALRQAWSQPELASLAAAEIPKQDDYDWQRTPPARDFLAFGGEAVGRSMIARAQAVRTVDKRHLLTISAWDPRLLRGLPGADVFDYWAPHSYEIYFIGPEISDQVMYQVGLLRRALPDRPRPVVIEEFGLFEDPKFPEPMREEHCGKFLEAGDRWGVAMMLWYDLTPGLRAQFTAASKRLPTPRPPGPALAFYVAPSEECHVLLYPQYMWRRKWGLALAAAEEAGYRVREVTRPAEAAGCKTLLVLGDSLTAAEQETVRGFGLPVVLTPGAEAAAKALPQATVLPKEREAQTALWKARLGGG